jgi:hypothetical protein
MEGFSRFLKYFLLVILATGFKPFAFSQAITISEEIPLRNDYVYNIMGWVDHDLLLFRDRGHQFFVQAFDEDLHLKWEREIYLGERKADVIGIVTHPDRFHLFYGMREKGDYYIHHRSYAHDLSLIDTSVLENISDVFITPHIQIKISEDESKVLLYQDDNSGLRLISYDLMKSKVLWSNEVKLAGSNLLRDFRSIAVCNSGDFFLVLEPDRFLQKVQSLEVFCTVPGDDKIMRETITLGDVQVYDYFPVYDNINKNLVITGLYSDRNSTRALGFYYIRYQPGLKYQVNLLPFDESLLAEVHGRDVAATRGLSDFNVQQVALRQDGGAVIIAELNKEFSRRSSLPMRRDNGTFSRSGWVDYYYEDLILFAVHPDGTEHWKEVLRKRQYSQDDDAIYSSFFLFRTPARLRFLFNDEIKQENTVGGYEVTGTGYVERKTVFNTDYQRLKLRFKDGIQVANNECIVPSERNSKLNLVRIVYEE